VIIGSRREEEEEGGKEREREQKCQLFFIICRYVKNLTFLSLSLSLRVFLKTPHVPIL